MEMDSRVISAFCEVHSLLRIANLYVKGFSEAAGLKVSVTDNVVHLETSSSTFHIKFPSIIKIQNEFEIQPTLEQDYIHLRLPTLPIEKTSGSSSTEVIPLPSSSLTKKSTKNPSIPKCNVSYRLECNSCQTPLTDALVFQRVLPLPSSSWKDAASDWYCHQHSHDGEEKKPVVDNLEPKSTDCLFSSYYCSISTHHLKNEYLNKEGKCFRCLKCATEIASFVDGHIHLWCHAVSFVEEENAAQTTQLVTPLEAIQLAIIDALEEDTSFFSRKLGFQDPNGRTLIIWFLGNQDMNLKSAGSSHTEAILEVQKRDRVLFKLTDASCKKELSSISVSHTSSVMLTTLTEVLEQSNLFLPPSCRIAAAFSVGFLSLF